MEKEISSGAMLGIVLIALAAVIGLGFGVFAIAKGTANEGVTGLQENLQAVGDAAFSDYDQKIVTGTQVNSAYQNFSGKNVAILVATMATKDNNGKLVDGAGATNINSAIRITNFRSTKSDGYETESGKGVVFVNYNAKLNGAQAAPGTEDKAGAGTIKYDNGKLLAGHGFAVIEGSAQVAFNNVSVNMGKSGMMEYVASGGRFQSYLIKDASGSILGIAFDQLAVGK